MDVLEVLQEVFEDIPDYEQQMEVLDLLKSEVTHAEGYFQAMELVACLHSGASSVLTVTMNFCYQSLTFSFKALFQYT